MILSCSNISLSFPSVTLFQDLSFHLESRDKAALIGVNGAGKSTLLKIITGEVVPDSGTVTIGHDVSVGYLAQYQDAEGDETIYEAVRKARQPIFDMEARLRQLEYEMKNTSGEEQAEKMDEYTALTHTFELNNGYACESEIHGVLNGLGFHEENYDRKLSSLSGGQKTRIVLGRLLLTRPDLLILDEPTNHLDMDSVSWLENFLTNYSGAVLVVSHDRYFLNRFVTRVMEIENGKLLDYPGDYMEFSRKKAELRRAMYHAWEKQQAEIRHQEDVIARLKQFNREKSIRRAESREKVLEKTVRLEKPRKLNNDMHLRFTPQTESGKDVLTIRNLSKSFPGQPLFSGQDIEIKRGERVAVIGRNGTGKTTLLKIINHLIPADQGTVTLGAKVKIGYYDQEQQLLNDENTVFGEISDARPKMTNTEIRSLLAAFLFTGDDVFKKIGDLSGGERGRVSLAKLMLSNANFLILDEPTNHLDIDSREILEDALVNYTGTVLFVSHDRYFINQTATRILELTGQQFVNYIGNYDYYLEKKEELNPSASDAETAAFSGRKTAFGGNSYAASDNSSDERASAPAGGSADWQAQKEEAARKRKLENSLKKTEQKIAELENRNKEIDEEFLKPETGTDVAKCSALSKEQTENKERLEQLYEEWETLSEQMEE